LLGSVDSSCSMPASASILNIGKGGWSGANTSGRITIRRLTYFPQRLPDSILQSLTS
jgi:hypothetical protein